MKPPRRIVQPTGNRLVPVKRSRLAGQREKHRLKRILGIGRLPQHATTDPHHQSGVTLNQLGKRSFISTEKLPQQFLIGRDARSG